MDKKIEKIIEWYVSLNEESRRVVTLGWHVLCISMVFAGCWMAIPVIKSPISIRFCTGTVLLFCSLCLEVLMTKCELTIDFVDKREESVKDSSSQEVSYEAEEMKQYYLEREEFCKIFEEFFDEEELYKLELVFQEDWIGFRFRVFVCDREYYILDMQTGMMLNWYEDYGKANTCNQYRTVEEIKEFLSLLKKDLKENSSTFILV